jgi:hypothetical protein
MHVEAEKYSKVCRERSHADTPAAQDDLMLTHPQHKQIYQYRNANRFSLRSLFPLTWCSPSPRPDFNSQGISSIAQRFQIGHQEFRVVGAGGTPLLAQHQGDITYMTQTHTRMICPKGPATFACTLSGDVGALIMTARRMRHEILQRLLLDRFPRTSDGKDKAPPACRIRFVPVLDHLHVGLGAVGSISPHNDQLRPTRRDKLTYHLAKQGIFTPIPWVVFGQYDAKAHRQAITVPGKFACRLYTFSH